MKKLLFGLLFIICSKLCFSQDSINDNCRFSPIRLVLHDDDSVYSNIRIEPKGPILFKLNNKIENYILTVTDFKGGWLKIRTIKSISNGFDISDINGWAHHSITHASTRKKVKLLDVPEGDIVGAVDVEESVKIKAICSNWVKVSYKDINGWVKAEWLCGHPVTTCP